MRELFNSLAHSRKFAALVLGLGFVLSVHLALDEAQAKSLAEKATALIAAYLVGQGVADHGKEAARAGSVQPSQPPPSKE